MGCKCCKDEDIGDEVILKSSESPFFQDGAAFLDMAICRPDRWKAELHAWTTIAGIQSRPVLVAVTPINYCPMCGRRLSLGAAERRSDG